MITKTADAKPLMSRLVERRLKQMTAQPPQTLVISGAAGSGKTTVATWYLSQLLGQPIDNYPYLLNIGLTDKASIGIDAVRQMEHFMTLKVPSGRRPARFVIVSDAELLTPEAQNAMLKTLEEPPSDSLIVLLTADSALLLPTIISRATVLELGRPGREQLLEAITARGVSQARAEQLITLGGGRAGLSLALAADDQDHPLVKAVTLARQLLQQSTFERLCQVEGLLKDRAACRQLLFGLGQMAHAALLTPTGSRQAARWQRILKASSQAESDLAASVSAKLVLTNLMLTL